MKLRAILSLTLALAIVGAFASRPRAITPLKPCPVSLTNPDGQELTLEKYDLRIAVDGPLSLTEMEMVFRNPQPKVMEGRFLYLLPPGATISRFAKEVGDRLMEGEVVERLRAQAVYTEILQSMRDPALLEMDQGNRFSARVFPIPANGTVRLVLAYSQRVPSQDGVRKVTVPLAGIPKIGEFNYSVVVNDLPGQQIEPTAGFDVVEAQAAQHRTLRAAPRKDYEPQTDLVLTFKSDPAAPRTRAIHGGNFQMLAWRPETVGQASSLPEDVARDWVFYFDTSASNADMEKRRIDAIKDVLTFIDQKPVAAGGDALFSAYAFDVSIKSIVEQTKRSIKDGAPAYGVSWGLPDILRARHALGATNLEAALKHIGEQARAAEKPQRFVLVSDGIATWGARETRDLLAALGDWPERHVLHALVIGAKQDEKTLAAITEKTHGRVVTLALNDEVEANVPKVISELTAPVGKSYEFYDESAEWIYPKTFRDVRPGSELVVFSQLRKDAPSKAGAVTRGIDGKAIDTQFKETPTEVSDFAPLLQREANAAYLSHLEQLEQNEARPEKRAELRKTRIDISVKNRVLCPLTSLLVLESENDYRRFGIDAATLADVMVVGPNGIELKKRTAADLGIPPLQRGAADSLRKAAPKKAENRDKSLADEKQKDAAKAEAGDYFSEAGENADATADGGGGSGGNSFSGFDRRSALRERASIAARGEIANGNFEEEKEAGQGQDQDRRIEYPAEYNTRIGNQPAGAIPPPAAANPVPAADRGEVHVITGSERREPNAPEQRPALSANVGAAIRWGYDGHLAPWAALDIPSADQLQVLHAQVAASPRDRRLRNAYANALCKAKKWDELQGQAFEWLPFDPENPAVYEYLGKSATGLKDYDLALRAMTSIAEIAPNRAALLARTGWLLLTAEKYDLAEAMFREALKNRKDDSNIYRGLALSLWLGGKFEQAAKELEAAGKLSFNSRYGDVHRVLREELAYVVRAWQTADAPAAAAFIQRTGMDADIQRTDALRATMCWETDANDVDLHIIDPSGEECYYSHMHNKSGLELYSDQTQGLGPEVIRTGKTIPGKYYIGVNYFSSGPMGVSRGVVVVMKPENGVVKRPEIVPFCLIPEGSDMRLITTVDF